MTTGLNVMALSATTEDCLHTKTNYDVTVEIIRDRKALHEEIDRRKSHKGLLIVPISTKVFDYIGKRKHVLLNRKTFQENFRVAKEMRSGIIVAMNIVECGANLDIDWAWDTGLEKHPILDEDSMNVYMETRVET